MSLSLSLYLSFFLVMSCLFITLYKCLIGHKSLGLLLGGVLKLSLSLSVSLSLYLFLSFFLFFCCVFFTLLKFLLFHKSLLLLLLCVLIMSFSLYLSLSIFGHVMSFHHSKQMSQRSQVSGVTL